MIKIDCEQQSDEWFKARAGIPSASNFAKIITATGKPSTSAKTYINEVLADWFLGTQAETYTNDWMQRGIELEPEAREMYKLISRNEVEQVGFCFKDEKRLVGASPDGLISDKGLVEIKCPKASTVISYMLDGGLPAKYKQQVQGQLWITGREWCDFAAYHPDMPLYLVRVNRDERYIKMIDELVSDFIETMLEKRKQLQPQKELYDSPPR